MVLKYSTHHTTDVMMMILLALALIKKCLMD